jgi:hypothetical protein
MSVKTAVMFVLQIEHEVFDFVSWKKAFDTDPKGRKEMGVNQYEIFCLAENANYVVINLWFEDVAQAENSILLLRSLWNGEGGKMIKDPQVRILDMMDWKFLS